MDLCSGAMTSAPQDSHGALVKQELDRLHQEVWLIGMTIDYLGEWLIDQFTHALFRLSRSRLTQLRIDGNFDFKFAISLLLQRL